MKRVLFLRRQMDGFGGMQRVSVDVAGLFKKKKDTMFIFSLIIKI